MTGESAETRLCRGVGGVPQFLFFYPQDGTFVSGEMGARGLKKVLEITSK
jgi:hypothetical protein